MDQQTTPVNRRLNSRLGTRLWSLLPARANGTLRPWERLVVEAWLRWSPKARDELEKLSEMRATLQKESGTAPPPAVWARIRADIRQRTPSLPRYHLELTRFTWLVGMTLILMALAVLWQVVPPGVSLRWSVEGSRPERFLVYRAPLVESNELPGEGAFVLVQEVPADPKTEYTFLDARLLPGQSYVYRVEALDRGGRPLTSRLITGRGLDALPGQLLLLSGLLVAAYGLWLARRDGLFSRRGLVPHSFAG